VKAIDVYWLHTVDDAMAWHEHTSGGGATHTFDAVISTWNSTLLESSR
jgi:hypothetical protein